MEREHIETLEDKLQHLFEMKQELRQKQKAFKESVKNLRECIQGLENIVKQEVLDRKESVTVGGIRAEYTPVVVIRMRKEGNNG